MEARSRNRFPILFAVDQLILVLILIHRTQCIDLESSKEIPCFTPTKSQIAPVDLSWVATLKKLYYTQMSRLDLYLSAVDMTGLDPRELTEDTVIVLTPEADGYLLDGFGVKKKYLTKYLDDDFGVISFSNLDGDFSGISYRTLTDNQTFFVTMTCFPDLDLMSWSASSGAKSLATETVKLIHDHVESLGFQKKDFTGLRYDTCK